MSLSISGSSGFLQAQQAQKAQAMFAKLDLNTDGSLSADEFSAIGQNMPEKGSARQLRGGGGFQGFSPETLGALMGVQQMSHEDRAAEIFSNADADGDGALSSEEFSAMKPPQAQGMGGPPPTGGATSTAQAEEEQTYDAADSNKDGTVSMSELLASLQSSSDVAEGFSTEASDLMARLLEQLTSDLAAGAERVTA